MLLFAGFALADGILAGFAALINRSGKQRWWILLQGVVSIAAAIFAFARPEATASILLYLVAAWALITGLIELIGAKRLDHDVSNERLLHRSAMVSIVFAVTVILLPRTGMLSTAQMFAAFAILLGLLMWVLSLNLRNMGKYARAMSHS
jgi:uncharacterized membrane protein HdeD (DUF308 family)